MVQATGLKIIAAGGISTVDDVLAFLDMKPAGIEAVIIGKALYAGSITLKEALDITEEGKRTRVC